MGAEEAGKAGLLLTEGIAAVRVFPRPKSMAPLPMRNGGTNMFVLPVHIGGRAARVEPWEDVREDEEMDGEGEPKDRADERRATTQHHGSNSKWWY